MVFYLPLTLSVCKIYASQVSVNSSRIDWQLVMMMPNHSQPISFKYHRKNNNEIIKLEYLYMRTVLCFMLASIFVKSDELVPRCTMHKTEHCMDVSVCMCGLLIWLHCIATHSFGFCFDLKWNVVESQWPPSVTYYEFVCFSRLHTSTVHIWIWRCCPVQCCTNKSVAR